MLIHYGSGSVVKSGLLDRVKKSLDAEGLSYVELGGVVANPELPLVRQGINPLVFPGLELTITSEESKYINADEDIDYDTLYYVVKSILDHNYSINKDLYSDMLKASKAKVIELFNMKNEEYRNYKI